MKKIFLFALAATLLLSACQATPEAEIVIQKDTDMLIEKAQETPETSNSGKTLSELYGIPDTLAFALEGAEGKLNISVDAKVSAPDGPLPIARAEAAEFSQETVNAFWNALIGDTPMVEPALVRTKAQIQDEILYFKRVQAGIVDGLLDAEEAQEEIDRLEAEYPAAPESVDPVPCDGKLKYITVDVGGYKNAAHYWGVRANTEDYKVSFGVSNNFDNDEVIEWTDYDEDGNATGSTAITVNRRASLYYRRSGSPGEFCREAMNTNADVLYLKRTDTLPGYAAAFIQSTPEQAATAVEAFLEKVGLTDVMAVSDIYLINDKDAANGVLEATAYAYDVYCARLVSGSPCANVLNTHVSTSGYDEYAPKWSYETLNFTVDDSGIFSASWSAPVAVTETVAEDSALKPFNEIEEIARKMLPVIYEPQAKEEYLKRVDVTINRVTLGLFRVTEQDRFDHGLYIPVWNFFGTYSETGGSDIDEYTNATACTLLTVNAIDGSIIDVERGY